MEIKLLKTFVMIARLKNFSAAARELNTVQPAVSRQIADLENELGTKLFSRTTREVSLTAAGEALFREAIEIIDHEVRAKAIVQRASNGQTGRIRIGCLCAACLTFLPDLMQRFGKEFPEVHVSIIDMTAKEQIEAFNAGQLDICLSRPFPAAHKKGVSSDLIYTDELAAFITSTHPLAKKEYISLIDLKPESIVIFKRSHAAGLFDKIITSCRTTGFSPHITSQPASMQMVLTEVASGLGLSIAPSCIRNLNMTGCVCLPIKEKVDPIRLEIHRKSSADQPAVTAFVNLVATHQQQIQDLMTLNKSVK